MKVVELIVHEQRQAETIPEKCPHCGTPVTTFSADALATGRVDYDVDGNGDGDLPEYPSEDLVYSVRCDECGEDLVPVPAIAGAGRITTWHLQSLASFLAGRGDPRATQRFIDELQPGTSIENAWATAMQEDRRRRPARRSA